MKSPDQRPTVTQVETIIGDRAWPCSTPNTGGRQRKARPKVVGVMSRVETIRMPFSPRSIDASTVSLILKRQPRHMKSVSSETTMPTDMRISGNIKAPKLEEIGFVAPFVPLLAAMIIVAQVASAKEPKRS